MKEKGKVLIVDDSKFSIMIISEMLKKNGYEIVGYATNREEVEKNVRSLGPDIVTMDMTLPGTDGFECTEIVKEINPDISVIMISALMDDELRKKAHDLDISGYIQKPIEEETLLREVGKVSDNEDLYKSLNKVYFDVFKESFLDSIRKMTDTTANFRDRKKSGSVEKSRGISIIIGIIGLFSGKLVIDLSEETGKTLVEDIMKKEDLDMETTVSVLSEWANIIAGNACSMINMSNKSYKLKIAPPAVFYGKSINISQVNLAVSSCDIDTEFGPVNMSVGFKRGDK